MVGKFSCDGGGCGGPSIWVGCLSELSDGVGDAVERSAAKLFFVGVGKGTVVRTNALWGGVVRCPCVTVATVNPAVSSNEDGDKREGLPSLWVSLEIPIERGERSPGGLGFVAPPPSWWVGGRRVPEQEGGDRWNVSVVACDEHVWGGG